MSFRFTPDEMSALSDEQKDMVLDVAVGALLADGTPQDVDMSLIEADLLEVPWGRSDAEMAVKVAESMERVAAQCTPEKSWAFVQRAAVVLTDPDLRTKTVALAARLAFLDGDFTKNEDYVLSMFATAFGIQRPTAQQIRQSLMKGE
jgi:hypothetical protein